MFFDTGPIMLTSLLFLLMCVESSLDKATHLLIFQPRIGFIVVHLALFQSANMLNLSLRFDSLMTDFYYFYSTVVQSSQPSVCDCPPSNFCRGQSLFLFIVYILQFKKWVCSCLTWNTFIFIWWHSLFLRSVNTHLNSWCRSFTTVAWPVWCHSSRRCLELPSCWIRNPATYCWSTHWSTSSNITCSKSTDTPTDRIGGKMWEQYILWNVVSMLKIPPVINCISSYRDPDITFFDQMNQPIVMYR